MQRLRFQALAIHEEAKKYSQRLWDRRKDEVLNAAPVDTGEFSPKKPETNYDGTVMGEAWQKLRNEYVGLDHRTLKHNFDLRNSEKPSRGALAWGNKMDKWAGSSTLLDDAVFYRSVLASPETTSQFKPGSVFVDKGVMSVGGDQQLAEIYLQNREPRTAGKVPTVFTIEAPKGTKMTLADQYDEGEYVVPRNAKLFISSAEEDENGVLRVTARLNPSDEQIAQWTNKSTSSDTETPTDAPETPESDTEKMEPDTISGESPSDTPETISGETPGLQAGSIVDHPKHGRGTIARMEGNGKYARVNFDKYDDPKKTFGVALSKLQPTGESKTSDGPTDEKTVVFPGESTAAVGAWKIGERVNHGKHGVGTIQRLEGNGEFARVHFDKDDDNPKRTYGVKLTKLGKGENGTPSSIKDPSTKVGDQKPKEKVNSGTTETRNVQTNDKGEKFILGKNDAELYVGAVVIHPKFGRGRVVKLENNGKYARVVFDNDPTSTPRGIVGAKLEDESIEKEVDRSGFVEKPTKK
jgi:ribosomal protein L35AE/L33A